MTAIFVGIDIPKEEFVVACRPERPGWTATNDAAGIAATVARLPALAPTRIVLEATGGYERALVAALLTRRRQLLEMLTAERNRLEHAAAPIRRSLADHIRRLERGVADVDRDLDNTIEHSPVWRAKENLLRSVPGVGPVVSHRLHAQAADDPHAMTRTNTTWQQHNQPEHA